MAYERYESRHGWRDPRSRYASDYGESRGLDRDDDRGGRENRGFFERAGDEVASWFGDEEAERRRREDARFGRLEEDRWGPRPRAFISEDEYSRYDRSPRFRDEGYRRPYTGRFFGRRFGGDDDRFDRGWSERWEPGPSRREYAGLASGLHDPHYSEWRRRQIDALDRDYDDYRRENQSRFESEFSAWRTTREGKRKLLGQIREHMTVVGSDEERIGTVDGVRGDHIVLTKSDSENGQHHSLSCARIDRVEGDRVILDKPAEEAKRELLGEGRERGFIGRDEETAREPHPHMLNRSFSRTYER